METVDDETVNAAIDFIKRQAQASKPFFCWWNGTRMHLYTHVRPDYKGRSGLSEYMDGMLEHDGHVGNLLKAIDDLGHRQQHHRRSTAPTTALHMNSWPDGGMTPFRSEKNTNWEGAYRVPAMVRWPGRISRARSPTRSSRRSTGSRRCWRRPASRHQEQAAHRLQFDGQDVQGAPRRLQPVADADRPAEKSARKEFFYINDDAQLVAMRYENWKMVFCEQKVAGHAGESGLRRSSAGAYPRCSICGSTLTSGPTSRRTPTTTGRSSGRS
jgi:arylsulfatase